MSKMGKEKVRLGVDYGTALTARDGVAEDIHAHAVYEWVCFDSDGNEKWRETVRNTVVTAGKTDILDKYFKGSAYTATWYVGLKGTGSVAAGDTMSSHAGWAEITAYSNANRPTLTLGTVSAGSVTTSSAASFNINGSATVAGGFLSTNNTVGGTTGTLYSAGDFSASRTVANGDTLNVNVTLTAS